MLWNAGSMTAYLLTEGEDLRVGAFDLEMVVRRHRKRGVRGGEMYIFVNRKRDRVKVLARDATGLWSAYKYLGGRMYPDPLKYRKGRRVGFVVLASDDLRRFLRFGSG